MEEASDGDTDRQVEYDISDVLLYLVECGLSQDFIFDWHGGWDYERLEKAFVYFKKREVEKQRDSTLATALGASSLLNKEPLEKFLKETESISPKNSNNSKQVVDELSKLTGMLNGIV